MKLAVIGCGNMNSAIVEGMAKAKHPFTEILTYTPTRTRAERLAEAVGGRAVSELSETDGADFFLLGFKPQQFGEASAALSPMVKDHSVLISVLAGTSIETLSAGLSTSKVSRVMPNTPCQVGQGVSLVVHSAGLEEVEREIVRGMFKAVSEVYEFGTEKELDTYTGVSGSGPAYVFEFSRQMQAWLEDQGLDRERATSMVRQTILGSAALQSGQPDVDSETLRNQVTSKKGVTFEALEVFRKNDWTKTTHQALEAAHRRVKELAKG